MSSKNNHSEIPSIDKGIYIHNKTGNRYRVHGIALDTETGEAMVVYSPVITAEYEYFVRPYTMFVENVELNGKILPRFSKVDQPKTFLV
jgi:hypothetical protein